MPRTIFEESDPLIQWLLQGDPAVVWQTKRDLLRQNAKEYNNDRDRMTHEGWGKQLLSCQDPEGTWGKGLYSPKWISTHYTLLLLRRLGLAPQNQACRKGAQILIEKGKQPDGGINFGKSCHGISETCISGMVLGIASYFQLDDPYLENILSYLQKVQMLDGGWNCELPKGAIHGSFHTTLSVLEGLQEYLESFHRHEKEIRDWKKQTHEFLLDHKLFRSHRTGEIIDQKMLQLSFPPRWKYTVIGVLDYFQRIHHPYDVRFEDAITWLKSKSHSGKWSIGSKFAGRVWFDLESGREPSRMNTLRALRILNWWDTIKN